MSGDGQRPDLESRAARDELLDRAVTEYLESAERGEPLEREELRARFPEIVSELDAYFVDADVVAPVFPEIFPGADAGGSGERPLGLDVPLPDQIGDYAILDEIARGGMGVVYRAKEPATGRVVALKAILAGRLASPELVERFRREVRAAANLEHPHIVPVYDFGCADGVHFYTMPCMTSGHLESMRADPERVELAADPQTIARLMDTIARAVHFAHERGVLHRDLKPANVFLDEHGAPRVGDFGLAMFVDDDSALTRTGDALGSPSYMAPEQAEGRHSDVSTRSDIYSLGAILYELLSGAPPFRGMTTVETLWLVVNEPPKHLGRGVPKDLETITMRCLEKDPARRFASAAHVADELARFARGEPILARTLSLAERTRRWVMRNSVALMIWSALLVGMMVAGAFAVLWKGEYDAARETTRAGLLAQARLRRASGSSGQRFQGLRDVVLAAEIRPGLDASDEAIACLALVDIEFEPSPIDVPTGTTVLALSPDGPAIAFANSDGTVTIRRPAGESVELAGCGARISNLWLSRRGRFVAARFKGGDRDGWVRLWDVDKAAIIREFDGGVPPAGVCFDETARDCIVARRGGSVVRIGLIAGRSTRRWNGPQWPAIVQISRSGRQVVIVGDVAGRGTVQSYDVETGRRVSEIHPGFLVLGVAWLLGDERIALVGDGQTEVIVADVASGEVVRRFQGHENGIPQVAVSPGGRVIVSYDWNGITKLWDAFTGREILSAAVDRPTFSFSNGGETLGWAYFEGKPHRLRIETGLEIRSIPDASQFTAGIAFHPSGQFVALCGVGGVSFYDLPGLRRLVVAEIGATTGVWFAKDGRELATCGVAGTLRWQIERSGENGKDRIVISDPRGHRGDRGLGRSALNAAWTRFAAIIRGAVVIADVQEPDAEPIIIPHLNPISLAVSGDGERIAAGSLNGTDARVWNAASGELLASFPWIDANVAFGGSGEWLIVAHQRAVFVHDVKDWKEIARFDRVPGALPALGVTSDGAVLAVAGASRAIQFFELPCLAAMASIELPKSSVTSVLRFSPDGNRLGVATAAGVVLVDLHLLREGLSSRGFDRSLPAALHPLRLPIDRRLVIEFRPEQK